MPEKYEGILDCGKVEDTSLEKKPYWIPASPRRWGIEVTPPAFLKRMTSRKSNLRPTAWLDGLRGFAAFLVYWHHHELWAHDIDISHIVFENSFGYEGKHHFIALPLIRNFFSGGHYAVSIFFVISGYVLSAKGLSLIQAGEDAKFAVSLGSSFFRRYLRLYIPVFVTTFLYMTSWHLFGWWTFPDDPMGTWLEQVWDWYCETKNYSFIFASGSFIYKYNFHAWSIPAEMRGSIIIFTALSAFSKCSRNGRLWCEVGLMFYFMYIADGWYGSMFTGGMLLCDLDLLASKDNLPRWFSHFENFKELIFFHLFVVSMYLGGVPSANWDLSVLRRSPGWVWLSYLKPQAVFDYKWFYLFWAAFLMVACVPRLPWLKRFFETRFCQYLGRISFSLYLVHGPVLWVLGERVYAATGWVRESHHEHIPNWINAFPVVKKGPLGLETNFFVGHLILLPVTLWLAEVVTRLLDEPSVKLSNWFYKITLPQQPVAPPIKA